MNVPTQADVEKACRDARPHLDRAAAADSEAVKADAWKQAAQLLGHASRMLDALAAAATRPDPAPRAPVLSLPGAVRVPSLAPGPR